MDRRLFLTGMLGLAGVAAVEGRWRGPSRRMPQCQAKTAFSTSSTTDCRCLEEEDAQRRSRRSDIGGGTQAAQAARLETPLPPLSVLWRVAPALPPQAGLGLV